MVGRGIVPPVATRRMELGVKLIWRVRTYVHGRRRLAAAVALVALVAGPLVPLGAPAGAEPAHDGGWKVVATGLDNPRGIDPGPGGTLLVAEAGKGGTDCQAGTDPETGEPSTNCLGNTGAVLRLDGRHLTKLVSLPSVASPDGSFASGPTHATYARGGVLISMMGIEPLPYAGDTSQFAKLLRLHRGALSTVADPAAFEAAANPDGNQIDSNPYGLASSHDGAVMTDAGGNSVIKVGHGGAISLLAALPSQDALAPPFLQMPPGATIPAESVPTSITRGPDGAWYVGELTGFPFQEGLARVWRIAPGHAPTVYATGFTNITDLQFDRHGNLFVLEMARRGLLAAQGPGGDSNGALIKIDRHGRRTTIASDGLTLPGGVAVDHAGHIYVTINSVLAGEGKVVRIR